MPLIVYATLDLVKGDTLLRSQETDFIDLSNVTSENLAEQLETIRTHQKGTPTVYIGFLDPVFMLSPYHETILRRSIATCRVLLLTSDPGTLNLSWKNGIDLLHLVL